jgi:hypothetical protein
MGMPAKPFIILMRKKGQKTIPFAFSLVEKPEGWPVSFYFTALRRRAK